MAVSSGNCRDKQKGDHVMLEPVCGLPTLTRFSLNKLCGY
jgi:hypothetical protein